MSIPNPTCWVKAAFRSLIHPGTLLWRGIRSSGHSFREVERVEGCTVSVLRCDHCGKVDVSWHKGAMPK